MSRESMAASQGAVHSAAARASALPAGPHDPWQQRRHLFEGARAPSTGGLWQGAACLCTGVWCTEGLAKESREAGVLGDNTAALHSRVTIRRPVGRATKAGAGAGRVPVCGIHSSWVVGYLCSIGNSWSGRW